MNGTWPPPYPPCSPPEALSQVGRQAFQLPNGRPDWRPWSAPAPYGAMWGRARVRLLADVPMLFYPVRPMERLWQFPYVIVRVDCHLCKRHGSYRLARLAQLHGAEITLEELLDALAYGCPWRDPQRRLPRKYQAQCGARFTDLRPGAPRPPDLPPALAGFRLIQGGKPDEPAPVSPSTCRRP